MTKFHNIILILLFLSTSIKPEILYSNKYLVLLAPPLLFLYILFIFKEEWLQYNLNYLRESSFYFWTFKAFQFSIFTQAIGTVLLGKATSFTENSIHTYSILPIYTVTIGPIMEEVIFRKIIFKRLHNIFNFGVAAFASSTIFAWVHYNPTRFPIYLVIGVIMCWVYNKSGNITTIIAAHIIINFTAILVSDLI
ncbi:CPBP family intramembrane glutamic endopeptidase [Paenibacillus caseinilyticus]|uniref:CPBP family intramembrane glutamic endopeptidase n=1 Tax=Paenibacillus mucilaginosus TaxID=61624 RepID=UPI0009DBFA7A|nr:type II CAAX endopeptidase family protein [Paenibacillus mucilaginosus]